MKPPDTKRRPPQQSVLPSEPRIKIAPDVPEQRDPLPTIPDIDADESTLSDAMLPNDTIPAPPPSEHDED